jgi:hypothetical protein
MRRFGRRADRPPAALVALLDRDERVVSWADTADGGVVAATPHGLWWPFPSGPRRIAWQHVDKLTWQDGVLTVIEADVVDDVFLVDRAPVAVRLTVPRDLPPTLRTRVEANIVNRELATVPGGAVRFVTRRRPGQDGLTVWARLEPGTPDTPAVRAAVRARVERLRERALSGGSR